MPRYYWKGLNAQGYVVEGELHVRDRKAVSQYLHEKNIIPLSITYYFLSRFLERLRLKKINNKSAVLSFTRKIVFLLQAKVQMVEALRLLEESEKNASWKQILSQLRQYVGSGKNLSDAMSELPDFFSKTYCAFVLVAEEAGNFLSIFEHILSLLDQRHEFHSKMKKALSYPIFLLICTFLTSIGIIFFIIPSYSDFFKSMGGDLPMLTQCVLSCSVWLKNNIFILLLGLGGGGTLSISLFLYMLRNPSRRIQWDRYCLAIPFIGRLILNAHIAEWSYLLGLALSANLSILHGLSMANAVMKNQYLRTRWGQLSTDLVLGRSFYESLQNTQQVDAATIQLVLIGENSGTLASMLDKIAAGYTTLLDEDLSRLARCTEPFAIIILAGLTGLVVTALYLPMIHVGLNI